MVPESTKFFFMTYIIAHITDVSSDQRKNRSKIIMCYAGKIPMKVIKMKWGQQLTADPRPQGLSSCEVKPVQCLNSVQYHVQCGRDTN